MAARPRSVAADESYWREIQFAFTLDRTLINLNNGNQCPTPTVVHEACKRYMDISNQAPVYHRALIERNIETARRRLAAEFGADPEEIAITRNASESLQIAQNGLDLEAGRRGHHDRAGLRPDADDVGPAGATRQDQGHAARFSVPDDAGGSARAVREGHHAADEGAALLPHHQPVGAALPGSANLSRMARQRGITTIVDGAHALGHFPFKLRDLEMDYYGVSLHKWLLAPLGTGLLYVRRDRIASTWPLQAAPERRDKDIRKFEEIGTSPAATKAAINEAIAFQQAIGIERKAARLRYLTLRWANELKKNPADQAPLESRAGTDVGSGRGVDRRHRFEQARSAPLGQVPHRDHDGRPRKHQDTEPQLSGLASHTEYLHAA